ncbi:MAG: SDR family NAD(P)-dependent oxidoreductase, partial [Gemmatimonadales bacterium]
MSDPLKGTTALVTGASRGIGLAVSRKLAAEGAAVVGLARSMQDGASEFGLSYHCNLSDPSGTAAVLERVVAEAGLPDVVILNAGQFTL